VSELNVKYKIWVELERCDYENDEYENVVEPEELGAFDTQEEAQIELARIITRETGYRPFWAPVKEKL